MVDKSTAAQSRTPLTLALILCVVFAVAALIGWSNYSAEFDKNQSLVDENANYRQQLQQLNDQIRTLTNQNQTVSESLAQSNRKTGELETAAQRLSQAKSTLQAELAQEQLNRQQIEKALAGKRKAAADMQYEMKRIKSNYAQLKQELTLHQARQSSLSDQVSAVSVEKQQLIGQLEQAQNKRQHLLEQIALVSEDVEAREAELSASRQNIGQLNRELSQTRQEQGQLETRVAQLSERQKKEAQHFAALKQRLEQELNESRVVISQLKNQMTVISLTSEVLFGSGSARIKPAGREVLSLIASTLNAYPDRGISIEGHTDNVPIGKGSFYKSNWELSAARALAAVDFLQADKLVSPSRLTVVGRGEFSPIAGNDTPEGRQLNRRIEIRLLPPGEAEAGFSDS